jgi:hypothetical protein
VRLRFVDASACRCVHNVCMHPMTISTCDRRQQKVGARCRRSGEQADGRSDCDDGCVSSSVGACMHVSCVRVVCAHMHARVVCVIDRVCAVTTTSATVLAKPPSSSSVLLSPGARALCAVFPLSCVCVLCACCVSARYLYAYKCVCLFPPQTRLRAPPSVCAWCRWR